MSEVSDGVHTSHCCHKHGCKYAINSSACPVENGRLKQEFPCEYCAVAADEENETVDQIVAWLEEQVEIMTKTAGDEVVTPSHAEAILIMFGAGTMQAVIRDIKARKWKK